jgi:hypothetical protein
LHFQLAILTSPYPSSPSYGKNKIHEPNDRVAKGPKFWPQNTKGAEKSSVRAGKIKGLFLPDLPKGADLF